MSVARGQSEDRAVSSSHRFRQTRRSSSILSVMRKTWSRIGGILGIAAILFAQVAMASHACSMIAPASVTGHSATNLDAVQPDVDNPGLCQKHCEDGGQSVNKSPSGSPPVAF